VTSNVLVGDFDDLLGVRWQISVQIGYVGVVPRSTRPAYIPRRMRTYSSAELLPVVTHSLTVIQAPNRHDAGAVKVLNGLGSARI